MLLYTQLINALRLYIEIKSSYLQDAFISFFLNVTLHGKDIQNYVCGGSLEGERRVIHLFIIYRKHFPTISSKRSFLHNRRNKIPGTTNRKAATNAF